MTLKRTLFDRLLAGAAAAGWHVLRALPMDLSSALGGAVARRIGPLLPVHRRAADNLSRALPEASPDDRRAWLREMWDNLGRLAGEHPHLDHLDVYGAASRAARVEVIGAEHIDAVRASGRPGLFFSGHLANWEVISIAVAQRGLVLDQVYRAANNRHMEWLYSRGRAPVGGRLIPKGPKGARMLLGSLREGRSVGMLVDQKMNDGIAVPFFGRDAMTAPALAELARKFDCPVIPSRTERLGGARFRCTFHPPLTPPAAADRQAQVAAMMAQVNRILEAWIRERPGQWLWVHNRWPKARER